MSTIPIQTLFGQRYRITTYLGESRIAAVHRADDLRLGRSILVHLLHSAAPAALHAHTALRGLLNVYDSGTVDGQAYVITEDVSGQPLQTRAPLPPLQAIAAVRAVAATIVEAYGQGVPIPPITSRNVWMMEHDRVVLLHDWHVPPAQQAQLEATYRAPGAHGTTPPADAVYALGVLLREALTGSPTPVRAVHVSSQLAQLVERATATDPRQRFPTPGALVQALNQYVDTVSAPTTFMPPAAQRPTTPVPRPPAQQRPQPASVVPPPRQTTVMAAPPPPLRVPATPAVIPPLAPTAQASPPVQPAVRQPRAWRMPHWRVGSWQRAVLRRGFWLVQRVVLIALILIGLNLAYNGVSAWARGISVSEWLAAQAPQLDIEQWIANNTPDLPSINVGEWAQQQTNSIRDTAADQIDTLRNNAANQIDTLRDPATYRVTQQINLRSEPSTASDATIIQPLAAGTRVQQLGTPQADANGAGYEWVRVVVLDGDGTQEGWVALLDDRLARE